MGYGIIALIGFGLGFLAGAVYTYVFGEKEAAEARFQGVNPEEENTNRASAETEGDKNE